MVTLAMQAKLTWHFTDESDCKELCAWEEHSVVERAYTEETREDTSPIAGHQSKLESRGTNSYISINVL